MVTVDEVFDLGLGCFLRIGWKRVVITLCRVSLYSFGRDVKQQNESKSPDWADLALSLVMLRDDVDLGLTESESQTNHTPRSSSPSSLQN